MGLEQLTEHVFYLPHEPETDRPMLAYVRGGRFSLAIDAGYSAAHVGAFAYMAHPLRIGAPTIFCGRSVKKRAVTVILRRCGGRTPFMRVNIPRRLILKSCPPGSRSGMDCGLSLAGWPLMRPISKPLILRTACAFMCRKTAYFFWATQPARTSSMEIIWIKASCGGSWNGLKTRTASIVFSAMQRRCENRSCWNIWRVFLHHVTRTVRCPYKAPQKVRSIEPAEIFSAAGRACCL